MVFPPKGVATINRDFCYREGKTVYLGIKSFADTGLVTCGFSTRLGGVSQQPYHSLNLAFHVGDQVEDVLINRQFFFTDLGVNPAEIVAGHQVHGQGVAVVTDSDKGRGARSWDTVIPATDALITATPGVPLTTYYADCVPVFLLDPVRRVIAVVHAGWKGTVLRIAKSTLDMMVRRFGTDLATCLAAIGPSIGPCCYQVDAVVADPVSAAFPALAGELLVADGSGRWKLNLWQANREVLLEAGLPTEAISTSSICTSCRNDVFFSHRADGGRTGRMAAVLMLKK